MINTLVSLIIFYVEIRFAPLAQHCKTCYYSRLMNYMTIVQCNIIIQNVSS